ncbi:serpin-Z1-like isoform X3 [Lotus japonicus]|uniref:serpin-Z1-like isoform X3 n=1 Tax=Lotus japonicus TaxID=34305 RepID=UPI0025883941|nr:serpin-Z1-like isoform X3 [Lotus japonicus]
MLSLSHSKIRTTMELQKSISKSQEDVALSFANRLFSTEAYHNENIVFSPLSLHVALAIMAAGAHGSTLDELLSFLRFDSVDHLNTIFSQVVSAVFSDNDDAAPPPTHRLSFANGMWVDKSLSLTHSFKQLVATHYKATLDSVDFWNKADQVCDEVNLWVEKGTNGLIKELLSPGAVDKTTRLIFANALHFKGEWEHKFLARYSYSYRFHLLDGTSVVVPLMTNDEEQLIRVFDGFKILGLPYKQASDVLKEFGVVSPFSQRDADFTKMVKVNSPLDALSVESIFQKVFIKVNEQGTEAAAATTLGLRGGGGPPPPGLEFIADHPFLFLIREDFSGTILFVGQVLNPLGGANGTTTPVKEDLGRKKRPGPVDNAERSKKKYSDFELEKNG